MFSLGSLTKIITFKILINFLNATYSCHWVSFDKSARILALPEEKSARAKIYPTHLTVNGVESLFLKR